jgi:hypothetical protein
MLTPILRALAADPDRSFRAIVIACFLGLMTTIIYSAWRIQIAGQNLEVSNRGLEEIRAYALRRDAERDPVISEIRANVREYRRLAADIEDHLIRQDRAIESLKR